MFDIFGTVLNWYDGLRVDVASTGMELTPEQFDRVVDFQGSEERRGYRSYTEITKDSLIRVLELSPDAADRIAREVGEWPLFPDSIAGLKALMAIAPCAAITNSDREHGRQVE